MNSVHANLFPAWPLRHALKVGPPKFLESTAITIGLAPGLASIEQHSTNPLGRPEHYAVLIVVIAARLLDDAMECLAVFGSVVRKQDYGEECGARNLIVPRLGAALLDRLHQRFWFHLL